MKRIILPLVLQIMILTCCQKPSDDPEKLKAVLNGYFDGITTKDYQKLNDLTTEDFILYENGKVWNNDSLIKSISRYPNSTINYEFDNLKISVDQFSGSISYYNHGEFILNDTTRRNINWVESATFRKVGSEWKMDFLHSSVRK